jgi:hypothetical protein
MGRWIFGCIAVVLLAVAAAGTWYFGRQFTRDLKFERNTIAALSVPQGDLAELSGQTLAEQDRLPIHLLNTTIWHLTSVRLGLQTADDAKPLSTQVTQNFSFDPWAPGAVNVRQVRLAQTWNGRPVRYRVISAEGFR